MENSKIQIHPTVSNITFSPIVWCYDYYDYCDYLHAQSRRLIYHFKTIANVVSAVDT